LTVWAIFRQETNISFVWRLHQVQTKNSDGVAILQHVLSPDFPIHLILKAYFSTSDGMRRYLLLDLINCLYPTDIGGGGFFFWGVKLTTDLPLIPRSSMMKLYLHFPIRIQDLVLD
jgi:hypothetical protein